MRIGICEDEKVYSERISQIVKQFFQNAQESVELDLYADGEPLLKRIENGVHYDLILLDLQLEKSDGMEVAEKIRCLERSVSLIFVTGMEDRAVEGYAVDALDYVVKNRLEQRLEAALQRYLKKRGERFLLMGTFDGEMVVLPFSEILWAESENRGTKVVTAERQYSTSLPISKINCQLPPEDFIEIHKAVFVRTDAIKRITADQVVMSNEVQLPLSRRKRKEVMKRVLEAVKGRME